MPSPLVQRGASEEPIGSTMSRIRSFIFQSYMDTTALEQAILLQPTNSEGFVASTIVEEQIPCYGVALHPDSETPVAVQFRGGFGDSGTYVLKPGESIRPAGLSAPPFSGIRWGLPFGWLGGGVAHLRLLLTADAIVDLSGSQEVVFHRTRMIVKAPDAAVGTNPNYPIRFPWPAAISQAGGVSREQRGAPAIYPRPTRTLLRLIPPGDPPAVLAAPAAMRIMWTFTDPMDMDATGAPTGNSSYIDVVWPAGITPPGGSPLLTIAGPEVLLGGDLCVVDLFDLTAGGDITGGTVDIVKYGRL